MRAEDPTIAVLLKAKGYATGQFGKNHFGDRDEHLPTMHGFDEFFGNLYHLNAEEEPELPDYPKPEDFPDFKKNFGPRGVLHSWANGDGTQRIESTGPLTRKRMETADDEFMADASAELAFSRVSPGAAPTGSLSSDPLTPPATVRSGGRSIRGDDAQHAELSQRAQTGDRAAEAAAMELVTKAARAAGYDVGPVWHGTPDGRWLKFDPVFRSQKARMGWGREQGVHWFAENRTFAGCPQMDKITPEVIEWSKTIR
jgi:hypothetical protein